MNQGEVCCASSRCYVHEKIYDEFVEKASRKMQSLQIGDPFEYGTDIGSLIDAAPDTYLSSRDAEENSMVQLLQLHRKAHM